MAPAKTKSKKAKAEEIEDEVEDLDIEDADEDEDDEDDIELDELDEDADEAPAKKKKSSQPEVTFGVADLAKYISEKYDKVYSTRDLRTLIRKMARDGSGRVDRVITAGNRTRYDWPLGLKDPEVKAILNAVKKGEVEAGRKEALDALKQRKAKKEGAAAKSKTKKSKKAAPPVDDDDDEDDDD